jgi:hypothetical protein
MKQPRMKRKIGCVWLLLLAPKMAYLVASDDEPHVPSKDRRCGRRLGFRSLEQNARGQRLVAARA